MSGRQYSVMLGKDPVTGEPTPIELDENGNLKVAAEITTPGGDIAQETGGNLETLAATTFDGVAPVEPQKKQAVFVMGGDINTTSSQTFASQAAAQASGSLPGTFIVGAADQGAAHPTEEWGVKDALVRTNTDAIRMSVASIDTKTPALVGGRQPVDGSGVTQPISAASLPLPTGAATSADQATGNASLSSIDSKTPALVAGRQPVDGSGVTQPISAASLPLPTGAATVANQATEIASLSSIDTKLPAQGPALFTAAQPVVLARPSMVADGSALPAAATSFLISSTPASLRRLEWRYTGSGTKYICIFDQAATPATAANWTKWYRPMTNGAGISYFEWPEGLFCATGIVVGVVATEPAAGVAITPSVNAAENFTIALYSTQ